MFTALKTAFFAIPLITSFLTAPLHAQPPPETQPAQIQQLRCGPHDKVTQLLRDRYVEKQAGHGVIRQHYIIEVHVSQTGSWTIIRTDRVGTACIMATGHSWQQTSLSPGDGV